MFSNFLKRLTAPSDQPLVASESRLALAALLVRVARSDSHYDDAEKTRITDVLRARYDLDAGDAAALRSEAETLEAEAPDTVRFTRAIKDAVPLEDRIGVIEALWQVALADGARDAHEDALLRVVASLLGINDRDNALARQRVSDRQ